MAERYVARTFSLPAQLSDQLDNLLASIPLDTQLIDRLGLNPIAQRPPCDQRGLLPGDYAALQTMLGSKLQGDALVEFGLRHLTHRRLAHNLVQQAQRRNQKPPIRPTVNISRVAAALLLKGLETLEADGSTGSIKFGGRTRRNAKQAA